MARPRWRKWPTRIALAVALASCFAYLPYRLLDGSGARKAADLDRELASTDVAIRKLQRENATLHREVDALKNEPAAIEDIARHQLGMVRPGELVIRVASPSESK